MLRSEQHGLPAQCVYLAVSNRSTHARCLCWGRTVHAAPVSKPSRGRTFREYVLSYTSPGLHRDTLPVTPRAHRVYLPPPEHVGISAFRSVQFTDGQFSSPPQLLTNTRELIGPPIGVSDRVSPKHTVPHGHTHNHAAFITPMVLRECCWSTSHSPCSCNTDRVVYLPELSGWANEFGIVGMV